MAKTSYGGAASGVAHEVGRAGYRWLTNVTSWAVMQALYAVGRGMRTFSAVGQWVEGLCDAAVDHPISVMVLTLSSVWLLLQRQSHCSMGHPCPNQISCVVGAAVEAQ